MAEPMPGLAMWNEDDPLCPDLLKRFRPPKKKWGPLPEPWDEYDNLYATLCIHQLAATIRDDKLASGIRALTHDALRKQVDKLR